MDSQASSSAPPAGWYPAPDGHGQRYWDGAAWTASYAPEGAETRSPAVALADRLLAQPKPFWLAGLAALLMIVGGFGPWATALNIVSVGGTRIDGWWVISGGAFALSMLWAYAAKGARASLFGAAIVGAAGAVLGIVDYHRIDSKGTGDFFGQRVHLLNPAWGLEMVIGAAIGLAVCAVVLAWRLS